MKHGFSEWFGWIFFFLFGKAQKIIRRGEYEGGRPSITLVIKTIKGNNLIKG